MSQTDFFYTHHDMTGLTIASTYVQLIREYMAGAGVDPQACLSGAALMLLERTPQADQGGRASYEAFTALLEELDRHGHDDLVVASAQRVTPGHLGVLGYVIVACETLGAALERLDRYGRLFNDGHSMAIGVQHDQVVLTWPQLGHARGEHRYAELGACVLLQFARNLTGLPLNMTSVAFAHAPAAGAAQLARFFGCQVAYHQAHNRVAFALSTLQLPLRQPDRQLLDILEQQAQQALAQLPAVDALLEQVRQHIGVQCREGSPALEAVAAGLHMTPRTLQRRLEALGCSFQQVLDQTRQQLCDSYLRDPRLALVDVGQLLGFADQSAFTRAHRRWTGQTPRQRRLQVLATDVGFLHAVDQPAHTKSPVPPARR